MDDHIKSQYETDFLIWIAEQVELLRARRFDQLDLDNLIEEVNDMGEQHKHELENRLEVLELHLLKYKYQPEHASSGWRGTIVEQRARINRKLKRIPSLRNLVDGFIDDVYEDAVARAATETGLPKSSFPPSNPFTKAQLLDPAYLPLTSGRRMDLPRRKRKSR